MIDQFADRFDAIEFLAKRLREGGMGPSADAVAETVVDEWGYTAPAPDKNSDLRAVFRPTRWVIRNQDLGLIEAVSGVLQGSATGTALAVTSGSLSLGLVAPAIAVATHLIKMGHNARNKGVQLSESAFFLLLLVREASDGASLPFLTASWNARYADAAGPVEPHLDRLAKYPATVGDLALIWKGTDDLWRTKDV